MTTFDMFINQFDELDADAQYELADTLLRRAIEKRRALIAEEGRKIRSDYDSGKPFSGIDRLREL